MERVRARGASLSEELFLRSLRRRPEGRRPIGDQDRKARLSQENRRAACAPASRAGRGHVAPLTRKRPDGHRRLQTAQEIERLADHWPRRLGYFILSDHDQQRHIQLILYAPKVVGLPDPEKFRGAGDPESFFGAGEEEPGGQARPDQRAKGKIDERVRVSRTTPGSSVRIAPAMLTPSVSAITARIRVSQAAARGAKYPPKE